MREKIKHMSDSDLIQMCNDLYCWKYVTGYIPDGSLLREIADENQERPKDIESIVLDVAAERYHDMLLLLLQNRTHLFVK